MQIDFAILIANYLYKYKNIKVNFSDLFSAEEKNKFNKIKLNFNVPLLTS